MINSRILKFPLNNKTDENFLAQPKINLQSFKSTPDSLKQRLKAFERNRSLGTPDITYLKWRTVRLARKPKISQNVGILLQFHEMIRHYVLPNVVFFQFNYNFWHFTIGLCTCHRFPPNIWGRKKLKYSHECLLSQALQLQVKSFVFRRGKWTVTIVCWSQI